MGILFNNKQRILLNEVKRWWNSSEQVYEFGGYAGTGKSTMFRAIIDMLGIPLNRVAPMSFIGQVAIVMRMKGLYNAKTIHSWLFNPIDEVRTDSNGNILMDGYYNRPKIRLGFEPKPIVDKDLLIVDEGGAVPKYLKSELESRNIKILVAGDLGQLRPVGDEPAYLYGKDILILDEIMRQNENSGLLYLATRARNKQPIHKGFYGDVYVINRDELDDKIIYNSDVVLCGKNKTRDNINNMVRHDILNIKSPLPLLGEKVICRKNNWDVSMDGINLANGLCGTITNMPGMHSFDGKTFEIDFKPNMLESSFEELKVDYKYLTSPYNVRQYIKNDKYSVGEKFEFAYATTVHSSQGSEYNNGVFIEETLDRNYHSNFLYTGITRFRNSLILVKQQNKRYF